METKQKNVRSPYDDNSLPEEREDKYRERYRGSWFPPSLKNDTVYRGTWPKYLFSPPPPFNT